MIVANAGVPGDPPWNFVQTQKSNRKFRMPKGSDRLESYSTLEVYEELEPSTYTLSLLRTLYSFKSFSQRVKYSERSGE